MSKKLIVILLTTSMLILSCPFIYANINANSPVNVLSELKIADKEDLNKKEPITTIEALRALANVEYSYSYARDYSEPPKSWYLGDTLKDMDYLDNETKHMLIASPVKYEDIPKLDLFAHITQGDALLYIVRMVGDTHTCGDTVYDYYNTPEEVYNAAYEKGLIPNADMSDKDKTISYKEFYNILAKSLYVVYCRGGEGLVTLSIMDEINAFEDELKEASTEVTTEEIKIPIEAHIDDNFNINWEYPNEYEFLKKYDTFHIYVVKNDGSSESWRVLTPPTDGVMVKCDEVVEALIHYKEEGLKALRFKYSKTNKNTYYHDMDISNIKVVTEGNEIKPGIFTKYNGWGKNISLSEGQNFDINCYYILKGIEEKYRVDKYNTVYYDFIKPEKEGNTYAIRDGYFVNDMATSDIHIMKANITKNADGGYTLHITPESTTGFEIKDIKTQD